ncbi:MAG TPA: VWA domain-containing protein [Thermoanaerobaculia bacterium]|nr:VWA domain-containing protein [Thermoanaerobaculia bacterium]
MKRPQLLAVLAAALLLAALTVPAWSGPARSEATLATAASGDEAGLAHQQKQEQEQEKEKDKKKDKKKRGKVVKATLVPSEPAADQAEEAEEAEEAEQAAAPEQGTAASEADAKAERKAEKESEKAAARAAREREKAAEAAEKQAEKQAAAERAAAEREEKEQRAAEREARRDAERQAAATSATPEERAGSRPSAEAAASPAASPATSRAAPAAPVAADVDPPRRDPPPAQRPQDVFQERIQVREVLLDVLVTDKRGNPVVGLGPDDFVITEEGQPREVTGVTYYGGVSELSGSGVQGETRTDRYFILFFHDQKQAAPFLTAAQLDVGRWTKRWVEEQLLPNDQVAVMGYDVRLKLYQDFTRDRAALVQAIDDAALGKREPDRWATRSEPELDPNSPSLAVNLPTGKTLARQTRKLQQALQLVGEAAEGVVGRKNLLLFSVGFGDIDGFGLYTPDPRYYPPMKQALNNGNVAIYAIDTVGSRRGNPGARDINDSLSAIANDTDGHYYSTFANVLSPLEQVAEDNIGYYLLAYRAEYPAGTSGYREVKVETRDKSFEVRARRGYKYGADS